MAFLPDAVTYEPPQRIGVGPQFASGFATPFMGSLIEVLSDSLRSHLHPTPEWKRFWETSRSMLSKTFIAGKSSSAEAIWKPSWHVVEPYASISAAFTRTNTDYPSGPSPPWEADFPTPLIQVQLGMGMGMVQPGLLFPNDSWHKH